MAHRFLSVIVAVVSNIIAIGVETTVSGAQFLGTTDATFPYCFIRNEGQWDKSVLFRGNVEGAEVWFTDNGVYYQFSRLVTAGLTGPDMPASAPWFTLEDSNAALEDLVVRTVFVGNSGTLHAEGRRQLSNTCNFYIGNDPSLWREHVASFAEVYFTDVYPGIDIRYYYSAKDLEYDFVVGPGADLSTIAVKWEGPGEIAVTPDGELLVHTKMGTVKERSPLMYQELNGEKHILAGRFLMRAPDIFGFELSEESDPHLPIIIDPVLQYSTYLGGANNEIGYGISVDQSGFIYVTGATKSSTFPTHNAYDSIYTGSNVTNVFVTKLSPNGSTLVYSTFLGGGGGIDEGRDIAVTTDGSVCITGRTSSTGFPVLNYVDNTLGGTRDAFVTRLSPTGTLIYSTFLGGTVIDEGYGIAVDTTGNAYVTGSTGSANFPVVNALDVSYNGQYDVFVTKLPPAGFPLVFSTFLGGSATEQANGIALDSYNNIYVTGFTNSSNFPKLHAYDSTYNGGDDIFVAKIAASGKPLLYSTYLGSPGDEQASAIAVGPNNTAFITGYTSSSDFPVKSAFQPTRAGGTDAIVARIDATGSNLVYSTFLGGGSFDYGLGIAIDRKQQACVVGSTISANFPTRYAYDSTSNGGDDIFITKLQSAGSALVFCTLLGGSGYEEPYDIALGGDLSVYVTGTTTSLNYPLASPFDNSENGGSDVIISQMVFEDRPCCVNLRGNVDGDIVDAVDIADLVFFVNYSFGLPAGPEPPCLEEADVDGNGTVDVADLVYLVDYMFSTGRAPVTCP